MKNNIQQLRKEHQITQAQLADQLEVSRQTIIALEKGKYTASLLLAYRIAHFFNQSIEDIFIYEDK
ncbi:helix-turn-helix transcriptional regulator [Convivina intestini]|uniref:Putative transcriptional regulator n=1 Tax=Convivina intestini TaxID=1505726 RepID=A0A2U1D5Z9_9LACO|nr:helix-turn-helix transcriptional regulator [Convivina intestini]PVY83106.1 putative transcriptional regulator [Convivina intestini]CAH1851177.1 hypothetical protein R078131_00241 [Convivina intestini]CAH1856675.1 hypothetical protein R077811_01308 [Convivina intestini]SDB97604.1 putative transcriptional regulator [Leuconostocaceae bacterium R-53105]